MATPVERRTSRAELAQWGHDEIIAASHKFIEMRNSGLSPDDPISWPPLEQAGLFSLMGINYPFTTLLRQSVLDPETGKMVERISVYDSQPDMAPEEGDEILVNSARMGIVYWKNPDGWRPH